MAAILFLSMTKIIARIICELRHQAMPVHEDFKSGNKSCVVSIPLTKQEQHVLKKKQSTSLYDFKPQVLNQSFPSPGWVF